MADRETLKNYLVGENGYLLNPDNNHKTIMLSGKWGSGKTYFWQRDIVPILNNEVNEYKRKHIIPNHYISLYGKTSIEQIKNEVFTEIYLSSNPLELGRKGLEIVKNTIGVVTDIPKALSIFGVNADLSKITDKTFNILEKKVDKVKLKDTINYLNSGAIICFDDFERKSKDIDLNDLFGFISQLTIEFRCKVVIILNDDVFEGEEKKIFSNVKEKTVSKYLYYSPIIEELFELIYNSDEKYQKLDEYKETILETIEETKELNARIYIQVLYNLLEWIEGNLKKNEDIIRCLILVNINFVLNHKTFSMSKVEEFKPHAYGELREGTGKYIPIILVKGEYKIDHNIVQPIRRLIPDGYNRELNIINYLIGKIKIDSEIKKHNNIQVSEESIKQDKELFKSLHFLSIGIPTNIDEETFQKINDFIESGILPNE